jgi:tetratricopeptide (TPR) repeat protein
MRPWILPLLCCLSASTALAQTKTPEQIFEEAERLYNIRDYKAALKLYKDLYLSTGEAALLYNMGQCHRFLGEREDALNSYKTFLRLSPDSPVRPNAEKFIVELETDLAANPSKPSAKKTTKEGPNKGFPPLVFYGGAGLTGLGGLATGVGFFILRGQLADQIDEPDSINNAAAIEEQLWRTKIMGTTSNILIGAAVVCAGAGWVLSRNKPEPVALRLALSANGLVMSGGF